MTSATLSASPLDDEHDGAALDLGDISEAVGAQVAARLISPSFDAWADAAERVGYCANPIRLYGHSTRVDASSGEILSSYSSRHEAFGITYVRCGNRRASKCPSCSRIYGADMFQLIRAGVIGGKQVPETIADNPLVFATLTAPSFGPVHGLRDGRQYCRPRSGVCAHGRRLGCFIRHSENDADVGQPLCWQCYDYTGHIMWQWWAPELWRRFTIALRRRVAHRLGVADSKLKDVASVQYAKVAEAQSRGIIHFHALIRADGPKTAGPYAPAPADLTADSLANDIRQAAQAATCEGPAIDGASTPRNLRFGAQIDTRPVDALHLPDSPGRELTAEQVAGYIAKYATKSATDDNPENMSTHFRRLRTTIWQLADQAQPDGPYARMHRWVHMLGFRGHFSTKSRAYSTTLGRLRRARRRWQHLRYNGNLPTDTATIEDQLLADDEETTLVIGSWTYAGRGWDTAGDAALAIAAAHRAHEHQRATTVRAQS